MTKVNVKKSGLTIPKNEDRIESKLVYEKAKKAGMHRVKYDLFGEATELLICILEGWGKRWQFPNCLSFVSNPWGKSLGLNSAFDIGQKVSRWEILIKF